MLPIAALALVATGSVSAQSLTGAWQATLQAPQAPGGQLRTVVVISTTGSGALSATMYSIDSGLQPVSANAVSLQGAAVKISIAAAGNSFEGRLSADGNSMTGTWHGAVSQPVTFTRATPQTAWARPEPPPPLKAMAANADPSFDVAIIKPSPPDARGKRLTINESGRLDVRNYRLIDLVSFAYQLHPRQLRGIPDGLGAERFDIEAKPDTPGQPSDVQVRSAMRKLLEERFRIAAHREKTDMTVYAIGVAKTGPKLTKTQSNATLPGFDSRRGGRETVRNATISDFASWLQNTVLDRPVVDQSGMEGRFDFALNWTPDETQFGGRGGRSPASAEPEAETFPDLFTAMQQQLGLKLESVRAAVDVLVIDHIEKPSEN